MSETPHNWQWWAGADEDWFTIGPEPTREAIIDAAVDDGGFLTEDDPGTPLHSFWITEALNPPIRLAAWCLDGEDLLERAEDSLADSDRRGAENDDAPCFEATPEQIADLTSMIRAACDAWQDKHGLTFAVATFAAQRNCEFVNIAAEPEQEASQ